MQYTHGDYESCIKDKDRQRYDHRFTQVTFHRWSQLWEENRVLKSNTNLNVFKM